MKKENCKFFTGFQHKECEAKVNYTELNGGERRGIVSNLPCIKTTNEPLINCPHFAEPTDEELAQHEKEVQAFIERLMKAGPVIAKVKKEHKGEDWRGVEECPVCGGKLHMTHASINGHVWGRCETANCLEWME